MNDRTRNIILVTLGATFTAPMYLRAFPGLLEADFDGVENLVELPECAIIEISS